MGGERQEKRKGAELGGNRFPGFRVKEKRKGGKTRREARRGKEGLLGSLDQPLDRGEVRSEN